MTSVTEKVREELSEVEAATGADEITEEVGDLLFAVANLARKLGVDPEAALTAANLKFERRFRHVEERLAAENMPLAEAGLERMERHWNEVRAADKRNAS